MLVVFQSELQQALMHPLSKQLADTTAHVTSTTNLHLWRAFWPFIEMKGVTLNFFALHCLSLLQLLSFRPTQEIGKFCAMTKESMPSATRRRHSLSLHAYIDHSPHPGKVRREQEKEKEKPLQGKERAFHSSLFGVQLTFWRLGKSFPSSVDTQLFFRGYRIPSLFRQLTYFLASGARVSPLSVTQPFLRGIWEIVPPIAAHFLASGDRVSPPSVTQPCLCSIWEIVPPISAHPLASGEEFPLFCDTRPFSGIKDPPFAVLYLASGERVSPPFVTQPCFCTIWGNSFPPASLPRGLEHTTYQETLIRVSVSLFYSQTIPFACPKPPRFERDADEGERPAHVQAHHPHPHNACFKWVQLEKYLFSLQIR